MCSGRAAAAATCWRTEALPNPPPEVQPTDPPEARGGGGTRNAVPLYDVPAHRILHHLVLRAAGAHLGAARAGRAAQRLRHRDADRRAGGARRRGSGRLSAVDPVRAAGAAAGRAGGRARATGRRAGRPARGKGLGLAFARYKNRAAYAAVAAAVTVEETVKVDRVWCVADAGLVVNPDGARNQLEGGIVQAAELDAEGAGALRRPRHRLARLGRLSDPALQRGAGDRRSSWSTAPAIRRSASANARCGPTAAAIGNAVAMRSACASTTCRSPASASWRRCLKVVDEPGDRRPLRGAHGTRVSSPYSGVERALPDCP